MKEKQILFKGPMVRAILEGRKTQTRRICSPQPFLQLGKYRYDGEMDGEHALELLDDGKPTEKYMPCPKPPYLPGDRLWVRETWAAPNKFDHLPPRLIPANANFHYAATEERGGLRWRPNIHMPRAASRITLGVTDMRVERVQDISDQDAIAEGIYKDIKYGEIARYGTRVSDGFESVLLPGVPKLEYEMLWESIYGPGAWDANPWVWVISFGVLEVKK